MKKWFVVVS